MVSKTTADLDFLDSLADINSLSMILIVELVFPHYTNASIERTKLHGRFAMDHPARAPGGRAHATVAAFGFLITVAIPVQAQTPPPQPTDITNNERVRQQEMSKREWQLRNLGIEPRMAANDP